MNTICRNVLTFSKQLTGSCFRAVGREKNLMHLVVCLLQRGNYFTTMLQVHYNNA